MNTPSRSRGSTNQGDAATGDVGVRVQPLPWPVVELMSASLRKLTHDLTNSLVAALSLVDLTLMKSTEPAARDGLARVRTQILRPRTTLQCAMAPLPGLTADRPRTIQSLATWVANAAHTQQLALMWRVPDDDQPPAGLSEPEWVHVLVSLCQNALDAHAGAQIDRDDLPALHEGWLRVESGSGPDGTRTVAVSDNGPGCNDLQAAAGGRLRRIGGGHLGLGLPIAAALLDRAGGSLDLHPGLPHGFIATVRVPRGR